MASPSFHISFPPFFLNLLICLQEFEVVDDASFKRRLQNLKDADLQKARQQREHLIQQEADRVQRLTGFAKERHEAFVRHMAMLEAGETPPRGRWCICGGSPANGCVRRLCGGCCRRQGSTGELCSKHGVGLRPLA